MTSPHQGRIQSDDADDSGPADRGNPGRGPQRDGRDGVPPRGPYTWLLDLVLVALLTVLSGAIVLASDVPDVLLWLAGVPLLLIYPGYAIISFLFPEAVQAPRYTGARSGYTIGWAARLALSLVLSPIVVASIALVMSSQAAVDQEPLVLAISGVTLLGLFIAVLARASLDSTVRAAPLGAGIRPLATSFVGGTPLQNVVLLVAVLVLFGSVAFAVAMPPADDAYTETFLVPNETGEYPEAMVVDEPEPLSIGVENAENEPMTYGVGIRLSSIDANGTVVDEDLLDWFEIHLEDGEHEVVDREIVPRVPGETVRVEVLVYEDEMPEEISREAADYVLQLQTTVEEE